MERVLGVHKVAKYNMPNVNGDMIIRGLYENFTKKLIDEGLVTIYRTDNDPLQPDVVSFSMEAFILDRKEFDNMKYVLTQLGDIFGPDIQPYIRQLSRILTRRENATKQASNDGNGVGQQDS